MISKSLRNLIKKAKKQKEHFTLYCPVCRMDTKIKGTPIRIVALKKEWHRQHNHKLSFRKRILSFFHKH